jgi:hypothetical protein
MRRNKVHRHGEKETHDAETNHRLQALRGSRAFHLPKVYHFLFVLFSFFLSFFLRYYYYYYYYYSFLFCFTMSVAVFEMMMMMMMMVMREKERERERSEEKK